MTALGTTVAGCGCGASGCSGNCGCGCCDVGGGICPEGAIARPLFFAGQLLTHEDVQLIVDYVVGKNRLHNRYLFGEGVVCGLSVTCAPCGNGSVVVAPGYGLDCCGNDIYVPCPVEVDVNALVRELRKRQLDGWDCGDPCISKKCDETQDSKAQEQPTERNSLMMSRGDNTTAQSEPLTYHYCLYIRYKEMQVAPVAPYVTDGACGAIACEPTRICESYSFELRCESERPAPVNILSRLRACIGDFREAAAMAERAQGYSVRAVNLRKASAMMVADAPAKMTAEDVATMKAATQRLGSTDLANPPKPFGEQALRGYLADYELLSIGLARASAVAEPDRPDGLAEAVRSARSVLEDASAPLAKASSDTLSDPIARESAADLFGVTKRTALAPDGTSPNPAEARMLRLGVAISVNEMDRMQADLGRLKAFLQDRIVRGGVTTSCDLIDRLERVRINADGSLDAASTRSAADAADELATILLYTLRDCICLALNPPCASCDDQALLLACLDVRDCRVIDICNMGRRFVLSPAALRYWLPPVTALGNLLERFCCEFEFRLRRTQEPAPPPRGEVQPEPLSEYRSFYVASAMPSFSADEIPPDARIEIERTGLSLADAQNLFVLGTRIGALGLARAPDVSRIATTIAAPFASPLDQLRRDMRTDIDNKTADVVRHSELAGVVDKKLSNAHDAAMTAATDAARATVEKRAAETLDAAKAAATEAAGAVAEKAAARTTEDSIKAARAEVPGAIENSRTVKKLLTDNQRMKDELKSLSAIVRKLQG